MRNNDATLFLFPSSKVSLASASNLPIRAMVRGIRDSRFKQASCFPDFGSPQKVPNSDAVGTRHAGVGRACFVANWPAPPTTHPHQFHSVHKDRGCNWWSPAPISVPWSRVPGSSRRYCSITFRRVTRRIRARRPQCGTR